MSSSELQDIFSRFAVPGTFVSATPFGSGLINDTFKILVKTGANSPSGEEEVAPYILQRLNHDIFTRPAQVMENIERVTEHLRRKIEARGGDPERETLTLVPTEADEPERFHAVVGGNYWRVFLFVESASTYDVVEDEAHVSAAARAFASFQRDLSDLRPPRLHETIPRFGDTGYRFDQFESALKADVAKRAEGCREEIDFCLARRADAGVLPDLARSGRVPERIVHYDTKINNVLIDDKTGEGICVIDLDTVMPGLALYDFGDAVRTATALAAEDETDLTKVGFGMDRFESLSEGYMSVAKDFLTTEEINHLAFAAKVLPLTIGLRFLADHLSGDVYFKSTRENHNLIRARTQFKMVSDMEEKFDMMKAIIDKFRT